MKIDCSLYINIFFVVLQLSSNFNVHIICLHFFEDAKGKLRFIKQERNNSTVNSTSDYTLWTLYRSYFKGISANIELQVYNVTCF
jgi:hypothetical protein